MRRSDGRGIWWKSSTRAALWRRDRQLLADAERVRVGDAVRRNNRIYRYAVTLRNREQRIARLDDMHDRAARARRVDRLPGSVNRRGVGSDRRAAVWQA